MNKMVWFYQIESVKPMIPSYNGDSLGRSNYIEIVNLRKTGMEMRGDQDESTRNESSKMERSQGIRDLAHVDKLLVIRFVWYECSVCFSRCLQWLAVPAIRVVVSVYICLWPLGSSLARDCLQTEIRCHLASSKVHWIQLPSKQVILF